MEIRIGGIYKGESGLKVVRIIIVSILILVFVISAGLLGWYLYRDIPQSMRFRI